MKEIRTNFQGTSKTPRNQQVSALGCSYPCLEYLQNAVTEQHSLEITMQEEVNGLSEDSQTFEIKRRPLASDRTLCDKSEPDRT